MQINPINHFDSVNAITDRREVRTRRQAETALESSHISLPSGATPFGLISNLQEGLQSLQQSLQNFNIYLEFSYDEEARTILVKLVDKASGEILRQHPSREALRLATSFVKLQGQIIDQQV